MMKATTAAAMVKKALTNLSDKIVTSIPERSSFIYSVIPHFFYDENRCKHSAKWKHVF